MSTVICFCSVDAVSMLFPLHPEQDEEKAVRDFEASDATFAAPVRVIASCLQATCFPAAGNRRQQELPLLPVLVHHDLQSGRAR